MKTKGHKMKGKDGCPYCGMAYSFFFHEQFHKKGCPSAWLASPETEQRIQALEDEGLTRSDAQGAVMAEDLRALRDN